VLGAAVYKAFTRAGYQVKGLAHSRPTSELEAIDLIDVSQVENLISTFAPHWVLHCAAERRPDVAQKRPEATHELNAAVPQLLAKLSGSERHPFTLIYISTDYVFDGTSPPYRVTDKPNPLQFYGQTKLAGEEAVLSVQSNLGARVVLRVPVLYGPVRVPSDSAINILLDVVRDQSGKQYNMDHLATRYPTNVLDVADFLVRLAEKYRPGGTIPPILHYSAPEPYTKYEICLVLAELLGLPHGHITPDTNEPAGAVTRPKDCHLSVDVIEKQEPEGLGMDVGSRDFRGWWSAELSPQRT